VTVDLAAPGVDVLSTVQTPGYEVFDGTSMASPHVAGVAALLSAQHPSWGPSVVKNAITSTVDKPDGLDTLRAIPGHAVFDGHLTATNGRLNLAAALSAPWPGPGNDPPDGTVRGADRLSGHQGRGKLEWPRDVNDVFRKKLKRGRRYRVSLSGPRREDFDLIVYEPGTKEVWQIEPSCSQAGDTSCKLVLYRASRSADESGRFRAKTTGKYVFQVSSYFSEGHYRLKVKHI
jgi:Subtilase family